jgi:hypothetical protein
LSVSGKEDGRCFKISAEGPRSNCLMDKFQKDCEAS